MSIPIISGKANAEIDGRDITQFIYQTGKCSDRTPGQADENPNQSPVTVKSEPPDIDVVLSVATHRPTGPKNMELVLRAPITPSRREAKCYETKYEAIKVVEMGKKSKTQIAKEFNVPVSTLATWVKNGSEIKEKYLSGEVRPQRKKSRGSKFPKVEQRLLNWFSYAQEQNIALSGEIIRRKARTIAVELNISQSEFECSSGWLERFKLRHGITFKRTQGKPTVTVNEQRPKHDKVTVSPTVTEESPDVVDHASQSPEAFFIELNDETGEMLESVSLNGHSDQTFEPDESDTADEMEDVTERQAILPIKRRLDSKSYKTKYEAIREVEKGSKAKTQIAKDYKIPMSTLCTWIKRSEEIKDKYLSGEVGPQRKKSRGSKFPEVERALLDWYVTLRRSNFPISGEMMRSQARSIAANLNIPESEFDCSNGWLERFKGRHRIAFRRASGVPTSTDSFPETTVSSSQHIFTVPGDELSTPGTNEHGTLESASTDSDLALSAPEKCKEVTEFKQRANSNAVFIVNTSAIKRTLDSKSYQTKYDALVEVETGMKSKKQIAKDFKVPTSTLSTWIKKGSEIKKKYLSGQVLPQRKNCRGAKYPEVEQALFEWFTDTLKQNGKISSEILRDQARYIASELKIPESEFDCSVGWLDRFKARHGIVFQRSHTGSGFGLGEGVRSASICTLNTNDVPEDYEQVR